MKIVKVANNWDDNDKGGMTELFIDKFCTSQHDET